MEAEYLGVLRALPQHDDHDGYADDEIQITPVGRPIEPGLLTVSHITHCVAEGVKNPGAALFKRKESDLMGS